MRGGVSLTSSISVLSFLGFTSIHLSLRESANNICLAPDWEDSSLRAWMGVVLPDYPRTPPALQEFREALNDTARDVWVQVGDDAWHKLLEVGAIYKTSKMGTSFEARRDSSVPVGVFELLHLCRMEACTFVAGSKSAGSKSDPKRVGVNHVSRLAYTGTNESPEKLPIVPPIGVAPVDQVLWSAWETGLSVLVVFCAGWGRLRSELPDMSPRGLLAYAVNRSFKFLVDNVIGVCVSQYRVRFL